MPRLVFIICVLCCGLVISCGSESTLFSGNLDSTTSGATTDVVVGGVVVEITVDSQSGKLSLTDVSPDDEVVIALFSDNEGTTAFGYEVGSSENPSFLSTQLYAETFVDDDDDLTGTWHETLRALEGELEGDIITADKTRYLSKNLSIGSTASFKVLNSLSNSTSYDTVTASLRGQNADVNVYVDDRNAGSLSDADLQDLLSTFSTVIDKERTLFGPESDVNGDGRFSVLFTQSVNELSGSSGAMVTGFFYAVDLHSASQYAISNEQEVFYTFVPDPGGAVGTAINKSFAMENIYPGVLAHEFQHMINYNQHHNVNGGGVETGWLNEALSHLVEDIYSIDDGFYMAEAGLENPARVSAFLSHVSTTCFSCGTALRPRGGGYLYIRYLYEQAELGNLSGAADGAALIGNLLNTSKTGIDNVIRAAFGEDGSQSDFKTSLGHFALALYLSNTEMNLDSRFNFLGINLRAHQDDNRGTQLQGPAIITVGSLPFVDSISGNGIHYLQIPGSVLLAHGASLNFSFADGSEFGGYLIH